jgi:hypothetical protein
VQPFFLIVSDAAVASIVDYDDAPIWSSDTGAVDAVGTADGRKDGGTEPAASWLDWMLGSVRLESAQPVDVWEPRSADASELAKAFEVPHGTAPTASEICLPLSRVKAPLSTLGGIGALQVPLQRRRIQRAEPRDHNRVQLVVGESHGTASIGKDLRMKFARGLAEAERHVRDRDHGEIGVRAPAAAQIDGAPHGSGLPEGVGPDLGSRIPDDASCSVDAGVQQHLGIVIEGDPAILPEDRARAGEPLCTADDAELLQSAVQTRKAIEAYFAISNDASLCKPPSAPITLLRNAQVASQLEPAWAPVPQSFQRGIPGFDDVSELRQSDDRTLLC